MIKLEHTDVYGFEAAVRGMRNPLNSWELSDSFECEHYEEFSDWCDVCEYEGCQMFKVIHTGFKDIHTGPNEYHIECTAEHKFVIGEKDLKLMHQLALAGDDHGKFARFINVTVDITAPTYWWLEFDTYKIGTVANSCSKMHKLFEKPFSIDDFSFDGAGAVVNKSAVSGIIIDLLNDAREAYLNFDEFKAQDELKEGIDDKKQIWYAILSLLPMGYNQRRTVQLNYQVLNRIYHARKNHKLDEWHEFCAWIEKLPYFKEIYLD